MPRKRLGRLCAKIEFLKIRILLNFLHVSCKHSCRSEVSYRSQVIASYFQTAFTKLNRTGLSRIGQSSYRSHVIRAFVTRIGFARSLIVLLSTLIVPPCICYRDFDNLRPHAREAFRFFIYSVRQRIANISTPYHTKQLGFGSNRGFLKLVFWRFAFLI